MPQTCDEDCGEDWVRAVESSAVADGSRVHIDVGRRHVSIIRHRGILYCIDSVCFHMGGPLGIGDIEEFESHICIVCPWHRYMITIDSGKKLFQAVKFVDGKPVKEPWSLTDPKQRIHKVKEEQGWVWVLLDTEPIQSLQQSDEYAVAEVPTDHFRQDVAIVPKYVRSGQVLSQSKASS